MKKLYIVLLALFLVNGATVNSFSQKVSIDLTFTAIDNAAWVQLESIKIMNRTQNCDTVLFYPDTSLVLKIQVGIPPDNNKNEEFRVLQNYPNPFDESTFIEIWIPSSGNVRLSVCDILGRQVATTDRTLAKGRHTFSFIPGYASQYILAVTWNDMTRSIKLSALESNTTGSCKLTYEGSMPDAPVMKALSSSPSFLYYQGDQLLFIGYNDTFESGILGSPSTSETYTFQFATNIPCPGTPTVDYEGQVYNTIQIFSQCWMKENLNVGTMIDGAEGMSDNSVIEKYCYDNDSNNCTIYGGLYQWWEMMQYSTQQGVQGICPPGWHLPTDEEWKVLEGAVDSQFGIGDPEWDIGWGWRGYDAGTNLKTTSGWNYGGNGTDLFGFSGLPGGFRRIGGYFYSVGYYGGWWTSTEGDYYSAWYRLLNYDLPVVCRSNDYVEYGFSVRCLRDY